MKLVFVGLTVIVIDLITLIIMRYFDDKPDILRIFYQDIPLLYVTPVSMMYVLTLFSFGYNVTWYKFIGHIIIINSIFKTFLRNLSAILEYKYDYYHLYSRYFSMQLHNNNLVSKIIIYSIDNIYICAMGVLFILLTKLKYKFYPLDGIIGMIAYAIITLTFEDL